MENFFEQSSSFFLIAWNNKAKHFQPQHTSIAYSDALITDLADYPIIIQIMVDSNNQSDV